MSKKLAFLIESELDKAEIVLAAKSLLDKLQKSAETLAKVEVEDLMPMADALKAAFGDTIATRFSSAVTDQFRATVQAISSAKNVLSTEVINLERSINGEPIDDMSMDMNTPEQDPAMGDEDPMGDEDAEMTIGDDDMDMAPEGGIDDAFGDTNPELAAGRAKKESFNKRGKKLVETKNSKIVKTFTNALKEGYTTVKAVSIVSKKFGIDGTRVVNAIKEHKLETKLNSGKKLTVQEQREYIKLVNKK